MKSKKIKGHLDLFSGIGGFSLALERSGIKPNWIGFSDIDKYANEIFQRRFKDAERLDDITNVRCEDLPKDIDLLTGGFPCQAFSQAGKRLAFEDTRGTLFYEIIRILKYYIEIKKPIKHFVLENVKGLYSAGNYTAFSTIYSFLSDIGYSVECQLLNSKFFGVPQNRERIYFVGRYSPGGGRPKVFPITQNAREVSKNGEVKFTNSDPRGFGWRDLSPTLAARDYKDPKWVKINKPDQVGKVCDGDGGRVFSTNGTSCTLKAQGGGWGAKTGLYEVKGGAIQTYPRNVGLTDEEKKNRGKRLEERKDNVSNAVTTHNLDSVVSYGIKQLDETLEKNKLTEDDVKALDLYNRKAQDISPTLTEPHHNSLRLYDKSKIRRLTPIECERLQGFPDNWTDGQSDTQRYKQCGNAITVNVAEAIFRKLYEVRR